MLESNRAYHLLQQVHQRLKAAAFGRAVYLSSLMTVAVFAASILVIRLLGLLPPAQQQPVWLLAGPCAALLLAALLYRRVDRTLAARRVDAHARTHDLFLTLATLETSAGEYQPLVAQAAETAAERIRPTDVVPFQPQRPLSRLLSATAGLALLIWLLPQLDPFGHVDAALQADARQQELVNIRKATRARQDQLKKDIQIQEERSEELDNQLEGLKSAFREMKPKEQQANSKVLQSQRNALNDQWKMVSSEDLRKLLSQQTLSQQFGGARGQKMNEWLKELQDGQASALQKELDQAKETMQAMLEAKSPEERQKLASQLRRQLQDMKKFSSEKAHSSEMAAALDKALKALEAAASQSQDGQSSEEIGEEAMEALRESLELSKQELQELARSAADLKKLEEALKTLQQAEKLNQQGELDGEKCEGCQTLEEYAAMYREMMNGDTPGNGTGQKGFGKGGEVAEDNSDPEGYQDEKSKTQVQAGKVLLSIKTKEYASEKDFDPNELRQYQDSVATIKSGVQAAIESEQVPPGYVDGIKGYFDKLGAPTAQPATPTTQP